MPCPLSMGSGTVEDLLMVRKLAKRTFRVTVRLLGVSMSNLGPPPGQQLALQGMGEEDETTEAGWEDASAAVDEIRERFGTEAIGPATLVDRTGLRLTRRGLQQWGPDTESPSPAAEAGAEDGATAGQAGIRPPRDV